MKHNTNIKGKEYHESVYERLNDAINANTDTFYIVEEIMSEFRMIDIERVLSALIEDRKRLVHYVDTTVDLYATDRPDLINDDKNLLFKLRYK